MTDWAADRRSTLLGRLADASGDIARRYFRTRFTVDRKADASPVTVADREAEAAIRAILAEECPDDGIRGEEFGADGADRSLVWIIDPIDGTKAFISGRPTFVTLIALLEDGVPVLGLIDQPVVGDRWIGIAGRPTLYNGQAAHTRPCPDLADAMLSTTAPDMFHDAEFEAFQAVKQRARTTTWGGDGYAYGLLASGFIDLVIEAKMKLHDFAALVPVIEGAGGRITDWDGAPLTAASDGRILAAGDSACHGAALSLLKA